MSRKKEKFRSIEPNKVKLYVCGVTVYDYSHIGKEALSVIILSKLVIV